ncbi:MAG: PP2C family protein-serine/threonine phosphatase [Oscillochloridaceae bacterium umkhey_bin13]
MRVRFSAQTHVGMRREINQDACDGREIGAVTLLVVCDGMGGHAAGEVASALGVATILERFETEQSPHEALQTAFVAANTAIYSQGHGSMGTTGVAALFRANRLYVANVGDSRAYLVREGQIRQISHDHSFVSDQVAAGLMTPEQARHSNVRNIITRALGHSAEVEVDLFAEGLLPGDTVLLSTDGMHGLITDDEIAELAGMFPPDQAAQRLVDLANERGGIDNITVMIAQVDELDLVVADDPSEAITEPLVDPDRPGPSEPLLSRMGLALASLTLIALLSLAGLVSIRVPDPAFAPAPTPTAMATPTP